MQPGIKGEKKPNPKEERKETLIAILIVVVVLGALGWWVYAGIGDAPAEEVRTTVPIGASPRIGPDDASVLVVMFSDFECPYCAQFAKDSFPEIKDRLGDDGDVLFVYKYFPLTRIHHRALRAAQAAACADRQDMFWEYHDLLYANQQALEIGNLQDYAREIGVNMTPFNECILNERTLATVQADLQAGINAGVSGTPTFFFNGRKVVGALTPEQFRTEVEKELVVERS